MSHFVSLTVVPGSPDTVSFLVGSWPPERGLPWEASDPIVALAVSPILGSPGESRDSSVSVAVINLAGR